ncbi:MAG TPA: Gfo/Idh/MocA family oxidoreductase [Chloroflexota bacterium]|jgi:UDP-N-acetylglucosamine 3-dehydrogenase|nr:Gfo/Idh/MocA family oxidoreductase [Chloroflexota bacterium]
MAIKTAVVGLGGIGRNHLRTYKAHPQAEVVAVCDVDRARADAVAAEFGVKAYYDLDELLGSESVDMVSVATAGVENGSHHYQPTMQALAAGKHVMCEKPLSNNLAEAKEMVAEAKRRNLCLAVDLNHRFTPATRLAKEKITSGELGTVLFVNMNLWIANRRDEPEYFHLRALHSHSVDVMRYLAGDVAQVQAFFFKGPSRRSWSNASINLRFASGAVGHLTGSYDMSMNHAFERTEVGGHQGRVVIDNSTVDFHWYPHGSREEVHVHNAGGMASFAETLPARLNRWIEQLAAGASPDEIEGSGQDGLLAHAVVEAAIRSHETGTVVDVTDLLS